MILVSCLLGGLVLDLFLGSGIMVVVCVRFDCCFVGFEINVDYCCVVCEWVVVVYVVVVVNV